MEIKRLMKAVLAYSLESLGNHVETALFSRRRLQTCQKIIHGHVFLYARFLVVCDCVGNFFLYGVLADE